MLKTCSVCDETKDVSEFRKATKQKDGLQTQCKACAITKRQKWMAENPGVAAAQSKALRAKDPAKHNAATYKWRSENPDKVKANTIRKRYGLTLEQWNEMFEKQQGKCLICEKHRDELTFDMAVDHCHKTGRVRGLLCSPCNRALGLFKDDVELLRKAASYLELPV